MPLDDYHGLGRGQKRLRHKESWIDKVRRGGNASVDKGALREDPSMLSVGNSRLARDINYSSTVNLMPMAGAMASQRDLNAVMSQLLT